MTADEMTTICVRSLCTTDAALEILRRLIVRVHAGDMPTAQELSRLHATTVDTQQVVREEVAAIEAALTQMRGLSTFPITACDGESVREMVVKPGGISDILTDGIIRNGST